MLSTRPLVRRGPATRAGWVVAMVVTLTTAVLIAPAAAGGGSGPRLHTPRAELARAVMCSNNIGRTPRKPAVLLVHGTGATPEQNWSWNYEPKLRARGFAWCTVEIPHRSWSDVQTNVEYVVHAIRATYRRSGAPIGVIGHSQGAFLPSYALRMWPDLAGKVTDLIGYAGTYTYGTDTVEPLCGTGSCAEAAWQLAPGSRLLAQLGKHRLPAGPSYTGFASATDEQVQPAPDASMIRARGARNFVVQNLCPSDQPSHITILAERPLYRLAFDALAHRGPASLTRVGTPACGYATGDLAGLAEVPGFGIGFTTRYAGQLSDHEPRLRRYWRAD